MARCARHSPAARPIRLLRLGGGAPPLFRRPPSPPLCSILPRPPLPHLALSSPAALSCPSPSRGPPALIPQAGKSKKCKGTFKTVECALNPVWDETVEFHGSLAGFVGDVLLLKVKDWDMVTKDDAMGEVGRLLRVPP